jgi:hypothetical protein
MQSWFRLAAMLLLPACRQALAAADTKVIVISIDGLKGTTLAGLAARKLHTPNLNEFVSKGAVSAGLEPVFPSVTYPNHTTIVTGRSPSAHGILGNTLFDPEKKMNSAWYWYAEQIKVPALWDLARQAGMKTAAVNWPVTVGAAIDFNLPEHRIPRTLEDRMLFRSLSTPGLAAEFEKAYGEIPVTPSRDDLRARMAAFLIRTRRPDLLLVHFMDLDHAEHGSGPDSPAALNILEEIDACVGVMRAAVRDAGLERQAVWFIVSDHGFWPVEKALNPNAILQSLGLAAPEGKPADWRVASYGNGGSFALWRGTPLTARPSNWLPEPSPASRPKAPGESARCLRARTWIGPRRSTGPFWPSAWPPAIPPVTARAHGSPGTKNPEGITDSGQDRRNWTPRVQPLERTSQRPGCRAAKYWMSRRRWRAPWDSTCLARRDGICWSP